ncbi:MAG: sulfite exporter TauE/SafE family protein [Verrucomicrobia bacterium]|nr:sulfite exporter TauE/SafE family protein [Verrucomicrobiota bacterium]
MHLETWQWLLAAGGAFLIGLSKTGIVGIGIFSVGMFALVFPSRESVGVVLPILITADIVAVAAYRRHAVWSHLWRLFPWAALGIVLGYLAMGRIDDHQVARLIGAILIVLSIWQVWCRRTTARSATEPERVPDSLWFVALVGIAAGFATMVANAAGPIMILYLLAMRLPKMEFIGTGAWYFLILNVFKVPFSWDLGIVNAASFVLDLTLAPFAIGGALFGRRVLQHINQALFEDLALLFTAAAAIRLLIT